MQLYNTASRQKEPFTPAVEGRVGLYACGITAYDYCHIGHARSAIVFDVLVRYLRFVGYDVTFVRNFTDVDDKIIARANQEGKPSEEIAATYIQAFHEDMDRLGVLRATVEPKATEHIDDMIALCVNLIEKGHAYPTPSGDVYFRVRSFAGYGKLSGRSVDDLRSGARVAPGEEKEDPLDFALWKAAKPGEPFWQSPWGKGRPGWHIECSAMSEKFLPLPLDIHGGGQDLVFPHHENEIAQTEAATGKDFSRFWVHNGFVQINSEKMAKSLGNFKTIRDILETTLPEVLRYFLLTRHYRSPIDFSVEALEEAEKNIKRLYEARLLLEGYLAQGAPAGGKPNEATLALQDELTRCAEGWRAAMDDDVNTAAALGHMNAMFHLVHRVLEDKALRKNSAAFPVLSGIAGYCGEWGGVLGLLHRSPAELLEELKAVRIQRRGIDAGAVENLMLERAGARAAKDFAKADEVRNQLLAMGIEVRDTPQGAVWDIV